MSVTRSRLIERLASSADITVTDADKVLNIVLDSIEDTLARGDRVELRDFGTFSARERAARAARNPRTGEVVAVDAKRVVHFKAGKQLLQILNGDTEGVVNLRAEER